MIAPSQNCYDCRDYTECALQEDVSPGTEMVVLRWQLNNEPLDHYVRTYERGVGRSKRSRSRIV